MQVSGGVARVELGEGVQGTCRMVDEKPVQEEKPAAAKPADLSSLSSMLQSRWKSGASPIAAKPDASSAGQIRSFRISKLDPASKKIELELAKK
jgi:small subunit ribosomal protein S1